MVKFNILLLLYGLEQSLEKYCYKSSLALNFDLTVRPSTADLFTEVPDNQRDNYLRYVSMVYRIQFTNMLTNRAQVYYLFVRNGKDVFSNNYTKLSSIEIGYITGKSFHSFFKEHLSDLISSDLIFSSFENMKEAARKIRNVLYAAICADLQNQQ